MNQFRSRKFIAALSLVAASSFSAVVGSAQTTASTSQSATTSDQDKVQLEKFVVTGSFIPAAADEANALPVQIVDSKMIEQSGVTKSALDVLRKTVPQIVGGNNIGVENGNIAGNSTNGGSQVSLRNTATLVLIDGQRVVFDPVSGTGGYQFVDLNVIPVSAIERIEVLTDGASAIYGSDAVSGVINLILKKNYQGAEIGGFYGFNKSDATGATYRDRSAHLTVGASSAKSNITVSAEWTKSDPLYERDYSYTSPSYGTASYPGVVNDADGNFYKLNPSLAAAPATPQQSLAQLVAAGIYVPTDVNDVINGFDLSQRPTFLGSLDKQIASVAFDHTISDWLSLKGSFLYAKTFNKYNLNPQPIVLRINNPADPTSFDLPGIPITDIKAQVRNRFLDFGNRDYTTDTNFLRGTVELDGKINSDWSWVADAVYNTSDQVAIYSNQILNSALVDGIHAGLINLTAIHQDPALIQEAAIFGNAEVLEHAKLHAYDVRANGRLFDLPAGSVYTALGVGYRKESSSVTADAASIINPATGSSSWNNGVSVNPFSAERTIKSMFLELKVPVTSPQQNIPGLYTLSLDGAVRHEIYSDTDDPTVPKISLRWLPFNDEFAVRSTFSKSFSAPQLYSLFGPSSSGSTPALNGITAYDSSGNPIGNFPPLQGQQQSGANPTLKPSKSTNYTVGVIYSPKKLKGFSVSVDYYNIKETDIVGSLASTTTMIQDVEQFGPASKYSQYVHLGNFGQLGGTEVTAPGQLHVNPANVYVDQFNANVASQDQDGVDLTLRYTFPTNIGKWDITSTWVYLHSFKIQPAAGEDFIEYVGFNGYGTLPKYRGYTTVAWENGAYSAALSNSYIDSVTSAGDPTWHVGSYTTFDIQGSMDVGRVFSKMNGLKFTIGINNVLDRYPPVDPNVFSDPPSDIGIYGAFGRFYFASFVYKF